VRRSFRFAVALVTVAALGILAGISIVLSPPRPVAAAARPAPSRAPIVSARPRIEVAPKAAPVPSAFALEEAMTFGERMKRWNPLIAAASMRFGVPQSWLHAVMQAESGGRTMLGEDHKIVSSAGAMGLMQLMPSTYEDMRVAYGLGPDPFDPHDNIFASAAYLRWLRTKYGYPTMFAAYNDGPGNLEERLASGGLLPAETRLYLVDVTASVEGRKGAARGMAQLTRPNGAPILVDCIQVTKIRAPLPEEYAPSVQSVVTIGKVRQGVREDLKAATAIIRAHGGAI
jgi:soluble lytic murein transglycosylase-like protein